MLQGQFCYQAGEGKLRERWDLSSLPCLSGWSNVNAPISDKLSGISHS